MFVKLLLGVTRCGSNVFLIVNYILIDSRPESRVVREIRL